MSYFFLWGEGGEGWGSLCLICIFPDTNVGWLSGRHIFFPLADLSVILADWRKNNANYIIKVLCSIHINCGCYVILKLAAHALPILYPLWVCMCLWVLCMFACVCLSCTLLKAPMIMYAICGMYIIVSTIWYFRINW